MSYANLEDKETCELARDALYYRNYFRTYVERDVRRILNVKDLVLFERFVTLLAGRVGQLVNFSALAGEVGVSSTTIATWISVLESSFLIYRLQPFHTNIAKRLVKSPKIYFTEPGLAAYLLGIETPKQLASHPLRGNLFENLAVLEEYCRQEKMARCPRLVYDGEQMAELGEANVLALNIRDWE